MFFYRNFPNPVTGESEQQFVKRTDDGVLISFFADGPLFEQYQAWVAEGNTADEWVG